MSNIIEFIERMDVPLLSKRTFKILLTKLQTYGNTLSPAHEQALWGLIWAYNSMSNGEMQGRYAFPLPCGTGKTQSIVSFCQALAELNKTNPEYQEISIAVSASKVEALCDLKRDLINSGVPAEWIGLFHSYKFKSDVARRFLNGEIQELPDGYASEPTTDNHDKKRILLCTHNRVRRQDAVDAFNDYKGKPRSLLIYDESLIKSDARVIKIENLQSGVGHFRPKKGNDVRDAAIDYIEKALHMVDAELKAQEDLKRPPRSVKLPELTDKEIQRYKSAFDPSYENTKYLRALLSMSENPLRVMRTGQGEGFISYEVRVSPELENIIILDASHNVRDLLRYDKTISQLPKSRQVSIDYGNLHLHQLKHCSGRHSMEAAFPKDIKKRLLSLEIQDVVKKIPPDEGILFFTFKQRNRGVNFEQTIKEDLKSFGIDTDAKVRVKERQGDADVMIERNRFNFLTWGNETSLSSFSFCRNVICVGILHRSHLEISGLIAGQADNLLLEINQEEIQEAVKGEVNHCLYQALARGSIRKIQGNKTMPMNAWIIDKLNDVHERLSVVLPGAQWLEWQPKYLVTEGKIAKMAKRIKVYLDNIPENVSKVSTRKIKEGAKLQSEPKMTFTEAVRSLAESVNCGWEMEGRSLVRFNPFATA